MNILIIGNGFDLAHGLPTGYKDFLEFTENFLKWKKTVDNQEDLSRDSIKDIYHIKYFYNLLNNRHEPPRYRKTITELNEYINDNVWIEYFKKVNIREGWIDFESEISRIVQILDDVRIDVINKVKSGKSRVALSNYELKELEEVLPNFKGMVNTKDIENYKKKLSSDLNKLIRCLEIYLSDYINTLEISKTIPFLKSLEIDKVLSFNYTNTYERVYDPDNAFGTEYDFIHGIADISNDIDTCNMVVGIDEYLTGDARNKDNEFIQFKKFYQRIYKGTGNKYIDWLKSIKPMPVSNYNPEVSNVYIYGHSLDDTDGDILRAIILAPNTKTTIFYHNKEAFGRQIANLVKVITEDEIIHRTGGENKTIEFCDINKFQV